MVCGWGDAVTGDMRMRFAHRRGDKGLLDTGHWGGRQGPDQRWGCVWSLGGGGVLRRGGHEGGLGVLASPPQSVLDVVGANPRRQVGERQGARTSSQPHQVHNRGLATAG